MIVPNKNGKPDFTELFGVQFYDDLPEEKKKLVQEIRQVNKTSYKITFTPEHRLRQEWKRELDERVNQIAEAVASGSRGQELADKMRKK